ncbi:pentapeptide repeat-containing protein [Solihabitans fulvus]|uniref:Pentapeptide repeat-containing protein n=1 Tax=Solihabitans fulvus TaxID=1892852 RepID=A0A5B2WKS0_9PSEU|nr:pentapeptide repeat-containing protein [Solihabitans fulvus]KAA2252673.1 pentapeptide repeat-containing protein [Solihabitans fulvus]
MGIVTVTVIAITCVCMWLLLSQINDTSNSENVRNRLDAIRTSLTVAAGAGGAIALWLTARKQRSTELQLREVARIAADTKRHQEYLASIAEKDSTERRITDLFTKAIEQLGSDKAAVRLGGFYSLERLANDNSDHRQTIVSTICGYLRMPFSPSIPFGKRINEEVRPESGDPERAYHQEELEVRLTAQRVLSSHFKTLAKLGIYWGSLDINLSNAILIDFEFIDCKVGFADFRHATFIGATHIRNTTFEQDAWFFESTFSDMANFNEATFTGRAIFTRTKFKSRLFMQEVTFTDL